MKITHITLNNFLNFQAKLKIDLTYPKGHPKVGKPLDKICFIGQSGTGKTTLLNLIKYFTCEDGDYDKQCFDKAKIKNKSVEILFRVGNDTFSKVSTDVPFQFNGVDYSRKPAKPIEDLSVFIRKELGAKLKNRTHKIISFPFSVVGPQNIINNNDEPQKLINPIKGDLISDSYKEKDTWDFTSENIKYIWQIVFDHVSEYISEYQAKEIEFSHNIIKNKISNVDKLREEFEKWAENNPNPIKELADKCLNPILEYFSLEVETDINNYPLKSTTKERYIIIKGKNDGKPVDYPFLSTGTKQIMLTAIPLFYLRPKESIILFDQPEASLYPNIQWLLPKSYLDIAPNNNQFFFATHSPVVASAFDPWEIVELKFDEKTGKVYRREFYDTTKPRNEKSYILNPKLLRWDSNYKKLFDLNRQGNEERRISLRKLAEMDAEIKGESIDPKKKAKLIDEYMKLAALLDWNID
ncbi:AAA family ATPase [Mucilaginibacter sp.]|uniref:ATP-binding protein n=1 Tax=Mucilaginibacter sp. TaxID=1882438 RepID=UPI00283BC195|nr:AAA family ATPase [Mucilaginibacter sp.]MDR3695775.1 AAA family ATPase [Mucilaginibacter sp.]